MYKKNCTFLSFLRVKNAGAYKSYTVQLTKYLIIFFMQIIKTNF